MNLAPTISKQKFTEERFLTRFFPIIEDQRVSRNQIVMMPARGNGKSHYQLKLIEAMLEGKISMPLPRSRYK